MVKKIFIWIILLLTLLFTQVYSLNSLEEEDYNDSKTKLSQTIKWKQYILKIDNLLLKFKNNLNQLEKIRKKILDIKNNYENKYSDDNTMFFLIKYMLYKTQIFIDDLNDNLYQEKCIFKKMSSDYYEINNINYIDGSWNINFIATKIIDWIEKKTFVNKWLHWEIYDNIFWLNYWTKKDNYVYWWEKNYETWKIVLVENNKEIWDYDNISGFSYKWDPSLLKYVWIKDNKAYIIENNEIKHIFDNFSHMSSSDDWKISAYWVSELWKRYMLVNWKKSEKYNYVYFPTFSSQNELAYWAEDEKWNFVVKNNVKNDYYEKVYQLNYSDDGKSFLYWATKNWKSFIVKDWKKTSNVDMIIYIKYKPFSNEFSYTFLNEWKMQVSYEWNIIEWYESSYDIHYSPDWKRFVFTGCNKGKCYLVENWKVWKWYDEIVWVKFSNDWNNIVYGWLNLNEKLVIVINGKEIDGFEKQIIGEFSNDWKKFIFSWKNWDISNVYEMSCL